MAGKKSGYKPVKAIPITKKKIKKGKDMGTDKKKTAGKPRKSYLSVNINGIANKERRLNALSFQQLEKAKVKKKEKKQRQEENKKTGAKPLEPLSTDDKREVDENFVFDSEDEELQKEEEYDEFSEFFKGDKPPKILITTSERPKRQLFDFIKEIKDVFPNSYYWPRKNFSLKDICKYAPEKGYTDIMVWRENNREVDELIVTHLPAGPTAIFKINNVKLNKEIWHHGNPTDHFPELILNNFNSKVGRRVGRMFASLFPQKPEFVGRRVCTFHIQRDFIFFRHHRYEFKDNGDRAALQEIGPRFSLKLKKLQLGTFDNVFGELEFQAKDNMYVSRKKTYL
ncbi:Anticodon-binding [Pseudocohnilembus persalinus]|uniref:Anticodon-binding n=1 Tax=Pseudocohnilembus persalinus TaxID=266149 RepID=A0A0V0R9Y7_PSEPJ|nr:Anticodon-binding [Pseudocohnilembus persalinus]|eukprot:KRX11032.1 Anticodon-binding [Pseudocohnilembus persalinus]